MLPAQRWDADTLGTSSSPSNTLANRLRSKWDTPRLHERSSVCCKGMIKVTPPPCLLPVQLYNFLGYLMDNFTPSSNERKISVIDALGFLVWHWISESELWLPPGNLISHIFRENEVCRDTEWERYFCYKNIEVPDIYSGPHLTFPLTVEQAVRLVEAFRNKKVSTDLWCPAKPLKDLQAAQTQIKGLWITAVDPV